MSPSQGSLNLSSARRLLFSRPCKARFSSSLAEISNDANHKHQVYISRSRDPYLNLAVEHFLLQKTPPHSTVLFLYTNRPCIVIGRNQNPWLEVNLGLLRGGVLRKDGIDVGCVDLVRRRSGGGTVFHDEGNVNYSVICPTEDFDRDKHARMVVRALKALNVPSPRVNVRHDIELERTDTPTAGALSLKPYKVSGSAYKLTNKRSLHHGTCLLSSPNIKVIGQYLRSPAKAYIQGRGVESVSSPIANVNIKNEMFEEAVVSQFGKMYSEEKAIIVAEEALNEPIIKKGYDELKSLPWTYCQTPQYTFSTHPEEADPRPRPILVPSSTEPLKLAFTVRNGDVTELRLSEGQGETQSAPIQLVGRKIHEIDDWKDVLQDFPLLAGHMNRLFGKITGLT